MTTKEFLLVEIRWVDAEASKEGWDHDDPEAEPVVMRSFGLLVRKDKNFVVHASTYDPESGRYSDRSKIPVGMVSEIIKIATITYEIED